MNDNGKKLRGNKYDSKSETLEHIQKVQQKLSKIINYLDFRRVCHDQSKLESPEKEIFDKYVPQLKKQNTCLTIIKCI